MTDYAAIIDRSLVAWNETDPDARLKAVAASWTETARFADPLADVTGHDQISAFIGQVQERFPGVRLTRGEILDGHHDTVRFTWTLGPVRGYDVLVLDGDRIALQLGFFD
ncbi:nuclear transport factor 2 family protein [Herbidospora cretacea]|uniref:nuclear transport factor 2 family protein n=1 Tax=Herbidospora cretacea TaxID=28444 RepID=UPI0004C3E846|nr:nuclear transport factor 2 family protein [Herbidospora cretacea]